MAKLILYILLVFSLIITGLIAFSPYSYKKGFPNKLIKQFININAPAEKVFNFLGNSHNASRWSSFVSHITVLNPDSFTDGNTGSIRRCFRNNNEKGFVWDEVITGVVPNQKRELSIYNLRDIPVTVQHLATCQLYETIRGTKCMLTFIVFFKDAKPTIWESLKLYIAAYKIESVFKRNLSNIKRIIESEQEYRSL